MKGRTSSATVGEENTTQAISRARALSPCINQDSVREAEPLCGRHWGSEDLKGELEE